MQQVVTVTINPALDVSTTVERLEPRKKLRGQKIQRDPGGGGINVARAIYKLGGVAHAVFARGGAVGRQLEELLADEGVPQTAIPIREQTRQSFTAYEQTNGLEYRFVMPGPELQESEWRALIESTVARAAEFLVLSGSLPQGVPDDFYGVLIEQLQQRDTKVVLDTSGVALRAGLEAGVFLAKPNLRELKQIAGTSLDSQQAREAAAQKLITDGCCETVALTLGKEGALFVWREGALHVPAPPVETHSSVGAGDSFVAGLVLRLAQGAAREVAFRFAVAAGTAALLTSGTALCCREDAERLYQRLCSKEA